MNPNKDIEELIKWLCQVQANSEYVNNPVLELVFLTLNNYSKILIEIELTHLNAILDDVSAKLRVEHSFEDVYNFLNCIIKAYMEIGFSTIKD